MNNASADTELVALEERVVSTGNGLSKLVTSIYEHKLEIKRYNALVNNDLSTALIVDRIMDVSRYVNPTVPAVLETVVGAGFARLNRMKEEKSTWMTFTRPVGMTCFRHARHGIDLSKPMEC